MKTQESTQKTCCFILWGQKTAPAAGLGDLIKPKSQETIACSREKCLQALETSPSRKILEMCCLPPTNYLQQALETLRSQLIHRDAKRDNLQQVLKPRQDFVVEKDGNKVCAGGLGELVRIVRTRGIGKSTTMLILIC